MALIKIHSNNKNPEIMEVVVLYNKEDFIIHQTISLSKHEYKNYTITHAPSGLAVKSYQYIKDAKIFTNNFAACPIKWDGKNSDNPPQEFLDALKKIILGKRFYKKIKTKYNRNG